MDELTHKDQAVELLQELGLKEYEAKSFVALTRLPRGTAKEVSELSEVPRTRVYDAVRVLDSKGLVEIQHSNPQEFRAVSIDEAVATLKSQYADRGEALRAALEGLEPSGDSEESDVTHEVWSLSGSHAISSRTHQLIDGAKQEIFIVIGHPSVFTDPLVARVNEAEARNVDVVIGTITDDLREHVEEEFPDSTVFTSKLQWLSQPVLDGDDTGISRILLVDREAILVSSFSGAVANGLQDEQAVFGRGFDNGLVTIVRRLMATGFLSDEQLSD